MTDNAISAMNITAAAVPFFSRSGARFGAGALFGIGAWWSLAEAGDVKMIFTADKNLIYVFLAIGILFSLLVGYFFKYQEHKKEVKDFALKFDIKYVVALIISCIVSGIVAYIVTFKTLGTVLPDVVIEDTGSTIILAFAIGGIIAFVVDACVWHPIVDGVVCTIYNKKQAEILAKQTGIAKSAEVIERMRVKAQSLGLVDPVKLGMLYALAKDDTDPDFVDIVQRLRGH